MWQNTAPFSPLLDSSGKIIGFAPGSGDYNANGLNLDYPDVNGYAQGTSRQAFLSGVFSPGQFSAPALGTNGNEKTFQFRNPMFHQTDAGLRKDTSITERFSLQLRFEFYNVFNEVNLQGVDSSITSATFGKVTAQYNPRWIQIGANVKF